MNGIKVFTVHRCGTRRPDLPIFLVGICRTPPICSQKPTKPLQYSTVSEATDLLIVEMIASLIYLKTKIAFNGNLGKMSRNLYTNIGFRRQ